MEFVFFFLENRTYLGDYPSPHILCLQKVRWSQRNAPHSDPFSVKILDSWSFATAYTIHFHRVTFGHKDKLCPRELVEKHPT
jgi:hypothetical protein